MFFLLFEKSDKAQDQEDCFFLQANVDWNEGFLKLFYLETDSAAPFYTSEIETVAVFAVIHTQSTAQM